ncbi:O-antigen ligase family protein [Pseudomonas saudiphocaensis]|uniref:O-antigen ligase-related domain-containing protein n=1 Tax=Pseudomonas saudiphocaensis TaxID=1499686 RepID=A0A078LTP5_9PSED|nr:O-antigen ligase family protein [Pseudomonas saudiphocaensis]CDZ94625.1 hypothetical protein BN1079_01949 [Pseudomonas saudiphocaensis]
MSDNRKVQTGIVSKSAYLFFFLVFVGYYIGLAVVLHFDAFDSIYYSVPLRVATLFLALVILFGSKKIFNIRSLLFIVALCLFFCHYFLVLVLNLFDQEYENSVYVYMLYALSYCIIPVSVFSLSSIDSVKLRRLAVGSITCSGFFFSFVCLLIYHEYIISGIVRISHVRFLDENIKYLSPISLGYVSALVMSICLYRLAFRKEGGCKTFWVVVVLLLSVVPLTLGSTRGSLVALLLSFGSIAYYSNKENFNSMLVFTLTVSLLGMLLVMGAGFSERLFSERPGHDFTSGRLALWDGAISYFLASPLFGGAVVVNGHYPHNVFLEALMSTGLVGFSIFSFIVFYALWLVCSMCKKDPEDTWLLVLYINGLVMFCFSGSLVFAINLFLPIAMIINLELQNKWPHVSVKRR